MRKSTYTLAATSLLASVALLGCSEQEKSLTVYTYDSFVSEWGPGPAIKEAFEAECDCTLNLVGLEDGVSILSRLKLEGKSSNADVILGIDNSLLEEARSTGLLAEHKVDTSNLSLPSEWTDNHFVPFDFGYFAFVYNSEKLPTPPSSLKELVEGEQKYSVIYQDPRTSTPGQGLMLWMRSVYGDQAPEAWSKLASQTVTVTKGWSEAYGMFLEGESDLVLSYTTSPAYHILAESDQRFKAAEFSEGHYLQVEVAAKTKSSKQPKLAEEFLTFMLSDKFQSVIPTTNWMLPVTDVKTLDPVFSNAKPAKTLSYSAEQVAEQRQDWINEWLEAVSR